MRRWSGGISEALSVCERKNGGRFGIAIEGNRIKALNAGCGELSCLEVDDLSREGAVSDGLGGFALLG